MNTFIISNDHNQTARCLDQKRLSQQIVDCVQLARVMHCFNILKREMNGRIPHTIIWPRPLILWSLDASGVRIPQIRELKEYCNALNTQWKSCHVDRDHGAFDGFDWSRYVHPPEGQRNAEPISSSLSWTSETINSHRAMLLKKDPTHYHQAFQREGIEIPLPHGSYVWEAPVRML